MDWWHIIGAVIAMLLGFVAGSEHERRNWAEFLEQHFEVDE